MNAIKSAIQSMETRYPMACFSIFYLGATSLLVVTLSILLMGILFVTSEASGLLFGPAYNFMVNACS